MKYTAFPTGRIGRAFGKMEGLLNPSYEYKDMVSNNTRPSKGFCTNDKCKAIVFEKYILIGNVKAKFITTDKNREVCFSCKHALFWSVKWKITGYNEYSKFNQATVKGLYDPNFFKYWGITKHKEDLGLKVGDKVIYKNGDRWKEIKYTIKELKIGMNGIDEGHYSYIDAVVLVERKGVWPMSWFNKDEGFTNE